MKKLLALLFTALLIVSALTLSVSAGTYDPLTLEARYATPTIDGEEEDLWAECQIAEIGTVTKNIYNTDTATKGIAKVLWDENYLYVFARITDANVYDAASTGTEDCDIDGMDIQISELDTEGYNDMRTEEGNGNFNVAISGALTGWGPAYDLGSDDFKGVAKKTDDGYLIEAAVPLLQKAAKVGGQMAVEFQINDNMSGKAREAIIVWNADDCVGHANSDNLGKIKFVAADGSSETTATEQAEPVEGQTEAVTEAKTEAKTEATPMNTEAETNEVAKKENKSKDSKTTANIGKSDDIPVLVWIAVAAAVVVVAVVVIAIVSKKNKK